jgi:hypothetical protein
MIAILTFFRRSLDSQIIALLIKFVVLISLFYSLCIVDAIKWDNAEIRGQILQIDKQDANSGTIQVLITEIIKKPNFGDLVVGKTISISYSKTPIQFQIGDCIEALGYWEAFLAVDPGGDHVDFIRKISCPSSPPPSKSCNPGPIGSSQCTGNAVRQLYQDSNCNQYWQTVDDCNRYIPSRCCQDGGCIKCGGQETYRCVNNVVQRLVINSGTEEWQVFDDCNSYNPPRQCIGGICVKIDEPPTPPQKECDQQSCKAQNQPIGVPYNLSNGIPCIRYKECNCDPAKESCDCISVETMEIKFKGTVVKISDKITGSKSYTINLDQLIAGPPWSGQLGVTTIGIFADFPKWGHEDAGIVEGNAVEVYGRCTVKSQDVHSVTLNGREEYYLKKVSSEGSNKPSSSKTFIIWVGDKNSKNLPGAEVFVDGVSKGTTDDKGEVRAELTFGKHTISAKADCGEASKDYDFSDSIDGASLYINSCPAEGKTTGVDIKFRAKVIKYVEDNGPGAPSYWTVSVEELLSGPKPCKDQIKVIIHRSTIGGEWGGWDIDLMEGDIAEVYGSYIELGTGCEASLAGKRDYYIKKINPPIPEDGKPCETIGNKMVSDLVKERDIKNGYDCYEMNDFELLVLYAENPKQFVYPNVPKVELILYDKSKKIFVEDRKIALNMYYKYYLKKNNPIIVSNLKSLLINKEIITNQKFLAASMSDIDIWREFLKKMVPSLLTTDAWKTFDLVLEDLGNKKLLELSQALSFIKFWFEILMQLSRIISLEPMIQGVANDMGNTIYSLDMRHKLLDEMLINFENAASLRPDLQCSNFLHDLPNPREIQIENACHPQIWDPKSNLRDIFKNYNSLSEIRNNAMNIEAWPVAHTGNYKFSGENVICSAGLYDSTGGFTLNELIYKKIQARNPVPVAKSTYIDRFYAIIMLTWFINAEKAYLDVNDQLTKYEQLNEPQPEDYSNLVKSLIYLQDWMRIGYAYEDIVHSQLDQKDLASSAMASSEKYRESASNIIKENLLLIGKLSDSSDVILPK